MKRGAAGEDADEQVSKKHRSEDVGSDAKPGGGEKKVWLSKKDRKAQKKQRQRSENVGSEAPVVPPLRSPTSAPPQQTSAGQAPVSKAKPAQPQQKGGKKGGKKDGGGGGGAAAVRPEVEAIIASLSDRTAGTLSDRLNPDHPRFDAAFKDGWKTGLSKKERALIVDRDKQSMDAHDAAELAATIAVEHPFPVNEDDHCETGPDAYGDIGPLLHMLAAKLGKAPADLSIYDPYFCAGGCPRNLADLGFTNVYNKCEDFYAVTAAGATPEHDVVVTNPPYSGDHVEMLLKWCRTNGRPFLLCMPNYFFAKPYYERALGGPVVAQESMMYLCPRKRYNYWTPRGLRTQSDKLQSNHKGKGGANRTSPFVSFWFLDLAPVMPSKDLAQWWRQQKNETGAILCKGQALPKGVTSF